MKVCLIYDGAYPWDVRVWKFSRTFVEHGHEVHLVCRLLHPGPETPPREETRDGVFIHRVAAHARPRVNDALNFPAFFSPWWIRRINGVVREHHIDLIVVRDLPLALTAIGVGRVAGVPVIYDMAEPYPAMLRDMWRFEPFRWHNLLVRNVGLATMVEFAATRLADHTVVVVEEARQYLLAKGVPAAKLSTISNVPYLDEAVSPSPSDPRPAAIASLSLGYVGGVEPMRGLERVLDMIPAVTRAIPLFQFVIVGGGKGEDGLRQRINALGLNERVVLTGRQEYAEAQRRAGQCDVGIIPHLITPHTTATIPNKLFEYMLLGKPVIATDLGPIARVIADAQCGFVYRNEAEFLDALTALRDPALRRRLGENGRQAVRNTYNWNLEASRLLQTAGSVARGSHRAWSASAAL
ncbi:MAG: glycosyltransferase family 4 protein [Nitrospirota bacterium]